MDGGWVMLEWMVDGWVFEWMVGGCLSGWWVGA